MNEHQHENLCTLLENPEHYEQALELVAALDADQALSAAMTDLDLEHWPVLMRAAQARSEVTLLAGLAHSAGLHETAPHLLEGLRSPAETARCVHEIQRHALCTLLRHAEHYTEGLALMASWDADDALSAAMADIEKLDHWPELFEAAQARSEVTLLAGLAHSAGLHETAPHLLEGLKSTTDAARCMRDISIAVLIQGFIFDECVEDELDAYWQPITEPEVADRICAAMLQESHAWDHFFGHMVGDGWGDKVVSAALTSPLSEDEDVLHELAHNHLGDALDSFFRRNPRAVWSHLLDWWDGLNELSPDVVAQLVFANLDEPKVVQALIPHIDDEDETLEQLLQALSAPHPEAVRLAIVEQLSGTLYAHGWQPRVPLPRLLAVIAAAPSDATLLPIMNLVCDEYGSIDEDSPDTPSPEECRRALNAALLQRLIDLPTPQACQAAVQHLQPPFSPQTVLPVLARDVAPAVRALLARLQETDSTSFLDAIQALADDELLSSISATAAEQLGLMWTRLGAYPDVDRDHDSLGLIMAAALAGDEDCADVLLGMGHHPDWALAFTRVAVHRDWQDQLSPSLIERACESESGIADDWLDELGTALFREPMEKGSISRWQIERINALGGRALDLVVAALSEDTEKTWSRKLFMLCGSAEHLLDIAPCFDALVEPQLPKPTQSSWVLRTTPAAIKRRWLRAIQDYLARLPTADIAGALSDPRRLAAAQHVLPASLDQVITDTLTRWLETDAHSTAAAAVLMPRTLLRASDSVPLSILTDPARLPAGLHLLAGSGPIDPRAQDQRAQTLRALLVDPPPARVVAVQRSRLWLLALLCAPQPLPELCPPQPKRIIELAALIDHPHAQAAAAVLLDRNRFAIQQHLLAALEAAADVPLLLSMVCAAFPNADDQALQQASTTAELRDALGMSKELLTSIDELELSVRTANCLSRQNIETVHDLLQHTEAQLLKTKNFGRKSLNELREVLAVRGLALEPCDKS